MRFKNKETLEKVRSVFLFISVTAMILTIILAMTVGFHLITGIMFGLQSLFSLLYGITDDTDFLACGL